MPYSRPDGDEIKNNIALTADYWNCHRRFDVSTNTGAIFDIIPAKGNL